MKIRYVERELCAAWLVTIASANEIIEEYAAQGFALTLRQLYYQFVARGLIENKQTEYKRLGAIVNDGRLAGLIDWGAIEDRTRNLETIPSWSSPQDIIDACAGSYQIDLWANQRTHVEVWVEKEALAGVIEKTCQRIGVRCAHFACRGYVSQSEMHSAAMRLVEILDAGKSVTIVHLGDHDPSGIDMTRDIRDRLELFIDHHTDSSALTIDRIALNMDQVKQYRPPPNPAKVTDSRFAGYKRAHGDESWELDALDPSTLDKLISSRVAQEINRRKWKADVGREATERGQLEEIASRWDDVVDALEG